MARRGAAYGPRVDFFQWLANEDRMPLWSAIEFGRASPRPRRQQVAGWYDVSCGPLATSSAAIAAGARI